MWWGLRQMPRPASRPMVILSNAGFVACDWAWRLAKEGNPPFPMKPERMGHAELAKLERMGHPGSSMVYPKSGGNPGRRLLRKGGRGGPEGGRAGRGRGRAGRRRW